MELILAINSLSELTKLKSYSKYIMIGKNLISKENITAMIQLGFTPVFRLDSMISPFLVEEYRRLIEEYKNENVIFYVTDLGLVNILKSYSLENRTIYDPITMITNSLDAKFYSDLGFKAIGLSNEITLSDLNEIIKKTSSKVFYLVFGYRLMLHSRRELVSLYKEKINQNFNNENIRIKEATRDEIYPIKETIEGTYIYRSYIISLLKEINKLNITYAYLDNYLIDNETYLKVVELFKKALDGNDINSLVKKMDELNLNIKDGFAYKDSVYLKEEF